MLKEIAFPSLPNTGKIKGKLSIPQDHTKSGSPVRDTHTCTHTAQVPAYKTTCTKSGSPVRDIHVHTQHRSLPTRPHKVRFAGQGHTYMYTHSTGHCLQDRTKSGSLVRDTHTHTAQVLPTRPRLTFASLSWKRSGGVLWTCSITQTVRCFRRSDQPSSFSIHLLRHENISACELVTSFKPHRHLTQTSWVWGPD